MTKIIFKTKRVEGKDQPEELGPKKYNLITGGWKEKKTIGLLLRMTQSMWHSGRVVILDSSVCVLQGIIELAKKGIFALALIKNNVTSQNSSEAMKSNNISKANLLDPVMFGKAH